MIENYEMNLFYQKTAPGVALYGEVLLSFIE
jgi:hypothetical protein